MMKHSDSDSSTISSSSSFSSTTSSRSTNSPIKGLHRCNPPNKTPESKKSPKKPLKVITTPNKSLESRKSPKKTLKMIHSPRQRLSTLTNATSIKPHDEPMQKRHMYFALDCEMVGVGPEGLDSALARLSIVNWDNQIVLDTYVKVDEAVTDYRTFVSGIKPEHINSASAMSLSEAQAKAKEILMGKILIGHGLTNDLKVIGIDHPWTDVRDTATYQPFMRERKSENSQSGVTFCPRKLRDLAWEELGTQIQVMGKSHSPIEDALTSMSLYKRARTAWELDLAKQVQKREQMINQRVGTKPMRFVSRRVGAELKTSYVVSQRQVPVNQYTNYQANPMTNHSRLTAMRQAQCDARARAAAALQHHVSMQRNGPMSMRQSMTVIPGYRTHCM